MSDIKSILLIRGQNIFGSDSFGWLILAVMSSLLIGILKEQPKKSRDIISKVLWKLVRITII